jgi:hypothetical protein
MIYCLSLEFCINCCIILCYMMTMTWLVVNRFVLIVGTCVSCELVIPPGQTLCELCSRNTQCVRCRRHLPPHLFDGAVCRACLHVDPSNVGRYSNSKVVKECNWFGDDQDCDAERFILSNATSIQSAYDEAIRQYMWVILVSMSRSLQFVISINANTQIIKTTY